MKRFLLTFLLLVSVFSSSTSAAEGLNLSDMSYEELRQLKGVVDQEYFSRPEAEPLVLYPGRYIVGAGLPSGLCYMTPADYGDYNCGSVSLYENTQKEADGDALSYKGFDLDEIVSFSLEEGNVLIINYVPLKVSLYPFDSSDLLTYECTGGVTIPGGTYRAGVDFPIGRYEVYPGGILQSVVYIYRTEESYENEDSWLFHTDCDEMITVYPTTNTQPKMLQVSEGNVFVVSDSIVMRKHDGFVFE